VLVLPQWVGDLRETGPVPYRVGVDLVAVATVEEALRDHGERYLSRIYSPAEVATSTAGGARPDPGRLAARFAAKEATLKVLRRPDVGIAWPSIEVVRTASGGVALALSGRAAEQAASEGLTSFDVSLTHEAGFAVAVVLAEESGPAR